MELIDDVITFTKLWGMSKGGKLRTFQVFIRLIDAPCDINTPNWDLGEEGSIELKQKYIDGKEMPPSDSFAQHWTKYGFVDGKMTTSAPTYVKVGKNIGRANETNVVQQAIVAARSKWNKKIKSAGFVVDRDEVDVLQNGRIKPMALRELPVQHPDSDFNIESKLYEEGETMFVSTKYDGNRMLAHLVDDKVELYGRSGEVIPNDLSHIKAAMKPILIRHPNYIFDGEAFVPGMPHELINGMLKKKSTDSSAMVYNIFDIYMREDKDTPFSERYKILSKIKMKSPLMFVKSVTTKSSGEIEKLYTAAIEEKMEGLVLRRPTGIYEAHGRSEIRSSDILKLKPLYDSEFKIIGFGEGVGKSAGAIEWVLQTEDGSKAFSATPKMSLDDRRKLFHVVSNFPEQYIGKSMRVIYSGLTKRGIPRHPRAVGIRE
jgi:ATP-dependent DNA ligase